MGGIVLAGGIPSKIYILFYDIEISFFGLAAPEFVVSPPSTIDISENQVLKVSFQVTGNPQPKGQSYWTHLKVPSDYDTVEFGLLGFSGSFVSDSLGSSYCGRTLKTRAINNAGKTDYIETKISMICKYYRL